MGEIIYPEHINEIRDIIKCEDKIAVRSGDILIRCHYRYVSI